MDDPPAPAPPRPTPPTLLPTHPPPQGILHSALHKEYWRLIDPQGKPPGVMGWWPSRAVTFLENHYTGSTQGHWPFPRDKIMQGYAYILTHPGTVRGGLAFFSS